jgi:hypothetical protein
MSLKNELTRIDVHGYDRMLDYSNRGGGDLATLYDSTGDDVMRARSHKVNFWGPGFDILFRQWEDVVAHAENGGRNVAKFHDTSGDDLVGIGADWGKLSTLLPGKTDRNRSRGGACPPAPQRCRERASHDRLTQIGNGVGKGWGRGNPPKGYALPLQPVNGYKPSCSMRRTDSTPSRPITARGTTGLRTPSTS